MEKWIEGGYYVVDVGTLLFELCEDERVFDPSTDLLSSGLLDSFAFIELFSKLEELGIELQPTQIAKEELRSVVSLQKLVDRWVEEHKK